jgi:phenylalanyl-tRNA synthetase beta chain
MPTVIVNRDALFKAIGQTFTDEEFDDLCFEFGIELDDVTSEKEMYKNEQQKEGENLSSEVLYKIEVAANRYDLLCLEGLALALRIFLEKQKMPEIKPLNVLPEEERQLIVYDSVNEVRAVGLCAILRDINFTNDTLKGFMDLQDKLHNNICRGRKLVSMGTHDLDTVKGPFTYRALKPEHIHFVPLNREEEVNGDGLMSILKEDPKLGKYLYLLEGKERYPVMMDSNGVIMSLPPIINSQHTKMTLNTHNVLIDVTGLDYTKCEIVLNTLIAMFSVYSKTPFTVEEIKVVNQKTGEGKIYPDLTPRIFKTDIKYLKTISGITDIVPEKMVQLLEKMELKAKVLNSNELEVSAPITRSDILHPCDIAEDLAISYGYNNITKELTKTKTHGIQQPYNKLTDLFRNEMSMGGYVEFLTMALLSHKDMFTNMLQDEKDEKTVQILYSKTKEFEYIRSSLIPGILKSIEGNKANQLPFKIFEISDVVVTDKNNEVGASNRRELCFAYANTSSAMEIVQGMVDLLMKKIGLSFNNEKDKNQNYTIKKSNNPIFFEDRQAEIFIQDDIKIGIYGIVHHKVLKNFGIKSPVTLCDIDLQLIMDKILKGELLEGFV